MTSLHDFFYITFWHDSAPYCILLISIRQCLLCSLIGAISVWAYPENSLRHLFNSSALLSTFSLSLVTFKTPWATTLCWCWLVSLSGLTVWSTSHQLWTQSEFGKCVYLINSYFFQGWVFFLKIHGLNRLSLFHWLMQSVHFSFTVQITLKSIVKTNWDAYWWGEYYNS